MKNISWKDIFGNDLIKEITYFVEFLKLLKNFFVILVDSTLIFFLKTLAFNNFIYLSALH